jgi:hypothetical protein
MRLFYRLSVYLLTYLTVLVVENVLQCVTHLVACLCLTDSMMGIVLHCVPVLFSHIVLECFPFYTMVTLREAILHWSLWKRQCYSTYQLFTGLCVRLLYSVPAGFPPDHKFSMWSFWTIRGKKRIQTLVIVNLKCTIWHVIHITI